MKELIKFRIWYMFTYVSLIGLTPDVWMQVVWIFLLFMAIYETESNALKVKY
jgi:hypothetical protein